MNTEKALTLLGQGHSQAVVASTLGVTESYISQLLSDEAFAAKVQELRVSALTEASEIDSGYNKLEKKLLDRLEKVQALIMGPKDILHALDKINGFKRRGVSAPIESSLTERVVLLDLPPKITYQFVTNINQQVVEIRENDSIGHSLVTIPTKELGRLADERTKERSSFSSGGSQRSSSPKRAASGTLLAESTATSLAELL